MRLGATLTYLTPGPPLVTSEWSRRLVGEGFESLWVPQIVGRGFFVPDPFVTLAVAATATAGPDGSGGVELGTATVQVPLHHPVDLAHRVLSLAAVCGGRLSLGISPGSTAADYAALDRDHASRFAVFRRDVARLRTLLVDGRDDDVDLTPPPDRDARPPLLLGSWGANVERAAREFDGWLASGYRTEPDAILAAHERYRAAGGQRAMVCAVPVDDDLGVTRDVLARYADAGIDDAIMLFAPDGPAPDRVRALLP